MAQINPTEKFTVVRQLDDPYDQGVYFVRAIIRDAVTDALLADLNLTDNDNQRFTKVWEAVSDPSGLGRWISIETTVYTDENFTVKSERYGIDTREHLIQQRYNPMISGHGGGADVDYKRLEKLFDTKLNAALKALKMPNLDVQPILNAITTGNRKLYTDLVKDILKEIPSGYDDKQLRLLLAGIGEQIMAVGQRIKEPEKVNLEPLMKKLEALGVDSDIKRRAVAKEVMDYLDTHAGKYKPEEVHGSLENIFEYLQGVSSIAIDRERLPKPPEKAATKRTGKDRSYLFGDKK